MGFRSKSAFTCPVWGFMSLTDRSHPEQGNRRLLVQQFGLPVRTNAEG
jgi:hypothetical protein